MVVLPHRPLPRAADLPVGYAHGPDSCPAPDVPPGRWIELALDRSTTYPGTSRRIRVHVPAGYDEQRAAAVMVYQDGTLYADPDGPVRVGVVTDALVHRGEIPVVVSVLVDPGQPGNRNAEYDAFDGRYADLLVDEVVPLVREHLLLDEDPERWGICGGSSGGNCALTAAWHRPDRFRRVASFLGSFAQIPGGNPYPELLRRSPRLPLRVFLQAASRDLGWDSPQGNWFAENLRVAAALAEAGYDVRLVVGDGGHSPEHGGVLLPDVLRWLWRDHRG